MEQVARVNVLLRPIMTTYFSTIVCEARDLDKKSNIASLTFLCLLVPQRESIAEQADSDFTDAVSSFAPPLELSLVHPMTRDLYKEAISI